MSSSLHGAVHVSHISHISPSLETVAHEFKTQLKYAAVFLKPLHVWEVIFLKGWYQVIYARQIHGFSVVRCTLTEELIYTKRVAPNY